MSTSDKTEPEASSDNDVPRHTPDKSLADIRLSFGTYFLVLVAGKERRSKDRLSAERKARPVISGRNFPLLLIVWFSLVYTLLSAMSFLSIWALNALAG